MPRFLHTADWQIGRYYSRFDNDDAVALAEARFSAVEKLAHLAVDAKCDAVLVAGDIFDAQTVTDRTVRRLFNALADFAGPWVMLPGNHDAALVESVWTRAERLDAIPDNVHLAWKTEVIELAEQGIAVLAAPLTQRHTYDDLTAAFDTLETAPGLLRVGLAHGGVEGVLPEEVDATNPVAADRAERAGLDYLALGDWHGLKRIDERTWYSGTPEPERFRNNDAGFALVVEIDRPGEAPRITPHEIRQYQWHQWREELRVPSDLDELIRQLEALSAPAVIDLRLSGEITLAGEARLEQALGVAAGVHRSVRCDRDDLHLVPTEEDIAELHADGYLGEVIDTLREQQNNGDDPTPRDALAELAKLLRQRQAREVQA